MSVYFVKGKGKGWRYDFTLNGTRYTRTWFKTKRAALRAETERREAIQNPPAPEPSAMIPTDMDFFELVNRRLDHVKAYNSDWHYRTYIYMAKRWVGRWENLTCREISRDMIQEHILERSKISAFTANKDLRYLRATFNFGLKWKYLDSNPTDGIDFLPVERKIKVIPPVEEIDRVIEMASPAVQDYLWAIRDTFARVGEINRLTWADVNLEDGYVVLYTRKKRHGHLTPRKVAMTRKVHEIFSRRAAKRRSDIPWVFWQTYRDPSSGKMVTGPYRYRRTILRTLCKKAGVRYFGFHTLRHAGASLMDRYNVPIGSIQKILGHENRQTTEIYLHSIDQAEKEAIAVYERAKNSHTSLTQRATSKVPEMKKGAAEIG